MADKTNFPKEGDNKAVNLRNSNFARFDLAFALDVQDKYPGIWGKGGNVKGNAQFRILSRIAKQGGAPKTPAEEKAIRLREAWAARHYGDHRVPGVVAQMKWLVVGELGEARMKTLINDEKKKLDEKDSDGRQAEGAGGGGPKGERDPQARGAEPPDEDRLYVRTADVRAVRREDRPNPATGESRKVVVVDFVASTEVEDSHESIVRSNWDLTRFLGNPVLLWMHGRMNDLPAVGNVENLHKEGTAHIGRAVFDDTSPFDREVAAKYEKGVLKGFSIGFYPRTVRFEKVDGREVLILDDIELLEISCVNVPSNPESLARKYEALRQRARAALLPQTRTTETNTGPRATTGERTMKKTVTIEERHVQVRAKGDGATCDVTCPECGKDFAAEMKMTPPDATKSAEYTALSGRMAEVERTHAETTAKLAAAEARSTGFEGENRALKDQLVSTRVRGAEEALTSRSGKKVWPKEIAHELVLARGYLADLSPDPDSKDANGNATRSMGERRWAERLAVLDDRPDLGVVTEPVTTTKGAGGVAETDEKVRQATGHNPPPAGRSVGGQGLAEYLDKPASAS